MNVTSPSPMDVIGTTFGMPYQFATEDQNIGLWIFVYITAVVGVIANGTVFAIVAASKPLRQNPLNIVLMSLCISDFMSAAVSPIMYYKSGLVPRDYNMPVWTCKLAVAIDHWTTIATVHHILTIGIYHVVALRSVDRAQTITPKFAVALVCFIWIETFATSGWYPIAGMEIVQPSQPYRRSCFMSRHWMTYARNYTKYYLPVAFFLPAFLVIALSIYILAVIRKTRRAMKNAKARDLRHENRAVLHICFIIGSFVVGYAPEIAFRIAIINGNLGLAVYKYDFFRLIFLRLSESLNPFLYNICSRSIRVATGRVLRKLWRCGSARRVADQEKTMENSTTLATSS